MFVLGERTYCPPLTESMPILERLLGILNSVTYYSLIEVNTQTTQLFVGAPGVSDGGLCQLGIRCEKVCSNVRRVVLGPGSDAAVGSEHGRTYAVLVDVDGERLIKRSQKFLLAISGDFGLLK
jgi:hypothetical protein